MLNKINRMLKQQEGFTLMELMIVVVIIGILAGIAVPLYSGIQERSKRGVGNGNADMLNRAAEQLVYLDRLEKTSQLTSPGEYSHNGQDFALLLDFIGYLNDNRDSLAADAKLMYVFWDDDKSEYSVVSPEDLKSEYNLLDNLPSGMKYPGASDAGDED